REGMPPGGEHTQPVKENESETADAIIPPCKSTASNSSQTPLGSSTFPKRRPPWPDHDDLPVPTARCPGSSTVFLRRPAPPKPAAQSVWDHRIASPHPRYALCPRRSRRRGNAA